MMSDRCTSLEMVYDLLLISFDIFYIPFYPAALALVWLLFRPAKSWSKYEWRCTLFAVVCGVLPASLWIFFVVLGIYCRIGYDWGYTLLYFGPGIAVVLVCAPVVGVKVSVWRSGKYGKRVDV